MIDEKCRKILFYLLGTILQYAGIAIIFVLLRSNPQVPEEDRNRINFVFSECTKYETKEDQRVVQKSKNA